MQVVKPKIVVDGHTAGRIKIGQCWRTTLLNQPYSKRLPPLVVRLLLVGCAIIRDIDIAGGLPERTGSVVEESCKQPVRIEQPYSGVRVVNCKVVYE